MFNAILKQHKRKAPSEKFIIKVYDPYHIKFRVKLKLKFGITGTVADANNRKINHIWIGYF